MGPGVHDVKDAMILNRLVHYGDKATMYEADPRLPETRSDFTSSTESQTGKIRFNTWYSTQLKQYGNYLALDRPDIAYSAKELARAMSNHVGLTGKA